MWHYQRLPRLLIRSIHIWPPLCIRLSQKQIRVQGGPSGRGKVFIEIKFAFQYRPLLLKRNSYKAVNKSSSTTTWATLYWYLPWVKMTLRGASKSQQSEPLSKCMRAGWTRKKVEHVRFLRVRPARLASATDWPQNAKWDRLGVIRSPFWQQIPAISNSAALILWIETSDWTLPLGDGWPDLAVHLSSSFDVFSKEDSVELGLEGAPLVQEEDTHSRIGVVGAGTVKRTSWYPCSDSEMPFVDTIYYSAYCLVIWFRRGLKFQMVWCPRWIYRASRLIAKLWAISTH